ncbi:MAG: ribonucleotide reductase, ribonucleoside-diphosphate reductase alpha chain [candidate division WWE3 bacterium CSP1-7]|uniref:Vitamin B12-dependent ribonucleotide reductase n=1 Tax=candidate division WWE3 bacterium CSP1-7 TaxID=1576480 RepID=A0A0T5ZXS2_UNCKA|nr:MAG: ribonucleotide reductase, ribonucleoside-diphosphate reductase alpha chain [candidate division WWE3 bacterium CSP1-7]
MPSQESLDLKSAISLAQRDFGMSENAAEVFVRRYVRKGEDGNPIETPRQTFERVASGIAVPEKKFGNDPRKVSKVFFKLLADFLFVPNSPTWTGAGTPLGQLAACFVLPIKDDLGRESGGIFSTLRVAALIQQTGGGNGFSFSSLRPRGDFVKRSGGRSTGPVGFLKAYDSSFGVIAQGGVRRGANMAVLKVSHPDVRLFIHCKEKEGDISNFNISVGATDEFMRAVDDDGKFELINPHGDKVWQEVDAPELFNEIITAAHHNGEPGILFLDTANRDNPVPHLYELEATNPCGEQWLGPYENCCLGSINLARHLTPRGKIDWEKLAETIRLSTIFLDDVVEANAYVPEVPELREAALAVRRIGLGIMGLADAMYALGVSYGGEDGLELAAQIMEFVRYHAMRTSIELARERKPFLAIKGSIYDPKKLVWQPPSPLYPYERDFGRPKIDWQTVVAGIKKYGIRNGAQTTVAPTGTISTVAGAEGYGCEPVFALSYVRKLFQAAGEDQGKRELSYTSPMFDQVLEKSGLDHTHRDSVYEEVRRKGTVQGIKKVPEEIRRVFVVSQDITPEQHIKMQAVLQRFVDNSISKTCNFPPNATVEDVRKAYLEAWKLGCKGLTVYVTGTRKEVVLETEETKQKREGELAVKPRPARTVGSTYRVDTPVGSAFVTVNENGNSNPLEVFVNVGKAGSDIAADAEAIGRLSSLVLRIDPTMSPKERVAAIIDQLTGIGGSRAVGFGAQKVRSLADGIAKILKEYLGWKKEEEKIEEIQPQLPVGKLQKVGDICPTCGQATLVNEEGCRKCYSCGYSEC